MNRLKDNGLVDKKLTLAIATPAAGTSAVAGGPYRLGYVDGNTDPLLFDEGGLVDAARLQLIVCDEADAAQLRLAADGEQYGLEVTAYDTDGVTVLAVSSAYAVAKDGAGLVAFSPEVRLPKALEIGLVDVSITIPATLQDATAIALSEVSIAWKPDCAD